MPSDRIVARGVRHRRAAVILQAICSSAWGLILWQLGAVNMSCEHVARTVIKMACAACLLIVLPVDAASADLARGAANYRAVMAGSKQLKDLTPEEMREVLAVYRATRPRAPSGSSESCQTAWNDAVTKADELERQAKKLAACAANRDFDDDCETETRHARSAQDDYESATSSVHSECR